MVHGRRLVHTMLLAPWHNMHAQRGSELGNVTADEHSGTLMRASVTDIPSGWRDPPIPSVPESISPVSESSRTNLSPFDRFVALPEARPRNLG